MIIAKEIIKKVPNTKYVGFYSKGENTVLTFFNDLASTLVATIEVEGKLEDGDFVFSNSLFSVLKKSLSKENNLTFNKILTLKIDNSKFTFNPIEEAKIKIEEPKDDVNQKILKINKESLIKSLLFVANADNKYRPNLIGVNISEDHICATDSYKCYINGTFNKENITIPQDFIKEIVKTSEEEIEITHNGNRISANVDGICWHSATFLGIYPDISRIVKVQGCKSPYEMVNVDAIKELFNQALMVLEQENTKIIFENKTLNVIVKDKYHGQALIEDMPIMKIAFAKPVFEVLGKFIQPNATLYYLAENRPLYIEKDQETIVLLPVKEI